ncbi:MAG: histidine kinase [Shewanella psychromarinicola]|jgi:predicted nicotinamide N-methyase|uniref:Calmodulin-lysine N-methyltransferase n=1 Tax=Shewanella psychromarinicola TaxID=2487742 RepID=A0A3N4E2J2_9GAMM|nr:MULTISPECIES: histidine kinase [Shewanella]AZG34307.1 histidine kinase [Shewanella psychromarinicola]MCL1082594.1 protein N-lysine methyltransferase family protein [Shewanella psychromarinicola]PKG79308.1 histidine kinase [Shewanella sp. Actino-trap-3]RPA32405.1 histidine kinase [Shewanella psychromarinicola]|tara:strand:- start:92405 stop:93070 length:666 start_codon:yes stop_codon:yes gene_type:complete
MTALRLSYQTVEFGEIDVHLCTLRNNQEFDDPTGIAEKLGISSANWPIFGIVWPSSLVLANYMLDYKTEGKRILEIGCGMALSSLLLNAKNADITATDYHPEVEQFLNRNTQLNNGKSIAFERVDWANDTSKLGLFDVIIGSDLLYEDQHVQLLAYFIKNHASAKCDVIIVDPGRGRKNKLTVKLAEFGFISSHFKPIHTDYLALPFKGYILVFSRNNVIA